MAKPIGKKYGFIWSINLNSRLPSELTFLEQFHGMHRPIFLLQNAISALDKGPSHIFLKISTILKLSLA